MADVVVKKDVVKEAGRCRVGEAGSAGAPGFAPGGARARIVEQNQRNAVVEVVCSCGRKITLQCEYAVGGAAGPVNQEPSTG